MRWMKSQPHFRSSCTVHTAQWTLYHFIWPRNASISGSWTLPSSFPNTQTPTIHIILLIIPHFFSSFGVCYRSPPWTATTMNKKPWVKNSMLISWALHTINNKKHIGKSQEPIARLRYGIRRKELIVLCMHTEQQAGRRAGREWSNPPASSDKCRVCRRRYVFVCVFDCIVYRIYHTIASE